MAEPIGDFVTASQASKETGYSSFWIRKLIQENDSIRGYQVGRMWLVHLADLKKYKAEMDKIGTAKFHK